ncbi:MAG: hypothetical protein CL790_00180 [Chloroflexi bacterium]|nr:hypothetical protein [Chloroflexota bacterium]HCU73752.1 hypothetical protein [Chloroflexota bacterium]
MTWLSVVVLGFSLVVACGLGYRVAAFVMGVPSRLGRAGLGVGLGILGLGIPMLWLPRIFSAGGALLAAAVVCACGLVGLSRQRAPVPERDGWLTIIGAIVVGVLVYISAFAFWIEATVGRADAGSLYLHSALVSGISRGNFPVINPFEPDYHLQYRVAMHTLAAGIVDLVGAHTRDVMPHLIAGTAVALVATMYGVLRTTVTAGWAMAGAVVAYSWGPLYWILMIGSIRERGLGEVLGVVMSAPETLAWSGLFLGGPFTMATHNPTAIFGLIPAVIFIAAVQRAMDTKNTGVWILVASAAIYLAVSNEYLIFVVPAGLGVWIWMHRPFLISVAVRNSTALIACATCALLIAQTTSGVLNGAFSQDSDLGRLGLAINSKQLGQLPSWGFNSRGPWVEWANVGWHDTSIVGTEFLIDGGLLLWLLLATAIGVVVSQANSASAPWLTVAIAGVAVSVLFRLEDAAPNLNRVAHAGFTIGIPALCIFAFECQSRGYWLRRFTTVTAVAITPILMGAFVLTAIAWPRMIAQIEPDVGRLEPGARDFLLAHLEVKDRLLVVHGAHTNIELFDRRAPAITLDISAETGQFIPYGYHSLSHVNDYRYQYERAQHDLNDSDLVALGVRYVFLDPGQLSSLQASEVERKREDGRFRLVYRSPSNATVIYRFGS